jgi:SAM-dependent methyltransferase
MGLGVRTQMRDVIDRFYLPAVGRGDLPPYSLRCHVGPLEEYETTPAEYIAYLKLLAGLRPEARMLDIGCGTGRIAAQLLTRPTFFTGRYEGFDVEDAAVAWATKHLGGVHPNVHFTHVDLYNKHYRPEGTTRPEDFTFPYPAEAFDLALAISVFTHLPLPVTERYLKETARVLAPGGKALFSFVLLQGQPDRLDPLATQRLAYGVLERYGLAEGGPAGTLHHLDGYSTLTPNTPEIVTFYEETVLKEVAESAGLHIDAIHHGSWGHEGGGPAFQDLVLFSRGTDGPSDGSDPS